MILDAEQVIAETVGRARDLEDAQRVAGVGDEEVAELERVPVLQFLVERLRHSFRGHELIFASRKLVTRTSGVTAIVLVVFHGS